MSAEAPDRKSRADEAESDQDVCEGQRPALDLTSVPQNAKRFAADRTTNKDVLVSAKTGGREPTSLQAAKPRSIVTLAGIQEVSRRAYLYKGTKTILMQNKERWGSRIGVILAVMGSAIGLGNFLRFPGLAAKYEGGAFMIPYFIALLLLGLPIAWLEWSMGRYGGDKGYHSSPGIFRALWKWKGSPYFGFLGLLVPVGIYMYYVFIEALCLYYAFLYLTGGLPEFNALSGGTPFKDLFAAATGSGGDGTLFSGSHPILFFVLVCFVLNTGIIYRGLSKGIEIVTRVAIPVLFVCAVLVLIRVLSLGAPDPVNFPERNVLEGLGYMWNPEPRNKTFMESLLNAEMWMEAAGQVFFSLSVGFGVIITYSSYVRRNEDVVLSGTTSASGNIFAEVALGGLITIPAAFIFLGPAGISDSTFALGFETLPQVFQAMPVGNFFGFLWFFLLFLAAITSSLSMLQPAIAFFEEGLGLERKTSVTFLGLITLIGTGFVAFFSMENKGLGYMDFWVGTFAIYLLAMLQVLVGGWFFGAEKALEEANRGSYLKLPPWVAWIWRYVSPAFLILIFILWIQQELPKKLEALESDVTMQLTVTFLVVLSAFFLILISAALRRWRKQEKEDL